MARRLQPQRIKPGVLAGNALRIAPSVDDQLRREIINLLKPVHKDFVSRVERVWRRAFGDARNDVFQPLPRDVWQLLAATRKTADELFSKRARPMAKAWLERVTKSSASSVKRSVEQLGIKPDWDNDSAKLQDLFELRLKESVGLIKTIPEEHFESIENIVRDSVQNGRGVADVIPDLQDRFGVTERRAKLIAFDQTRKAFSEQNEDRMQEAGIQKWRWIHSGGTSDPREMHIALHGRIFTWDNPPIIDIDGTRGMPGDLINCRCTMQPVLA